MSLRVLSNANARRDPSDKSTLAKPMTERRRGATIVSEATGGGRERSSERRTIWTCLLYVLENAYDHEGAASTNSAIAPRCWRATAEAQFCQSSVPAPRRSTQRGRRARASLRHDSEFDEIRTTAGKFDFQCACLLGGSRGSELARRGLLVLHAVTRVRQVW